MKILATVVAALILFIAAVAPTQASTPTPTKAPTATPTPTPTPTPEPGPDLEDLDAVLDALLGAWSYVGPVSGRDRTVSILPNGFMAWNTDPNSVGWEYYAESWSLWTFDRGAILVLSPEEGLSFVWEIEEWEDMDVMIVNWVEEGEEDAVVTMYRVQAAPPR